MGFETLDALSAMAADSTPGERARMQMDAADRREQVQADREQAEREAARQERTESLALADRQLGNPLGELSRARAALSDAQDQVLELAGQLEVARGRESRSRANLVFWAERMGSVTDSVERSAQCDPFEAARTRATEAHREFARNTRQAMRAAAAGEAPRSRRPFAAVAVRGEEQNCKHCRQLGATEQESFAIHHGAECRAAR